MSTYVLGLSAYYHDAAAALVCGGDIVAAAQEERFSRKKHDPRFPRRAINYCLGEAFIDPSELAAVVFYDNPLLSFDRMVKSVVSKAPGSKISSSKPAARSWASRHGSRTTWKRFSACGRVCSSRTTTWRTPPVASIPRRSTRPRS